MKNQTIAVSGGVVGLAVLYLGYCMFSPAYPSGPFNLADFASLPIADHGRVKPIDTLARTSLMVISGGRQSWRDDQDNKQPAARWLLDVMATAMGKLPDDKNPFLHKVFRIENDQLRSLLNLEFRKGFRYSIEEMKPRLEEFYQQANRAQKIETNKRDVYDRKVVELAQHLETFLVLMQRPDADPHRQAQNPPHMVPPWTKGEEWRAFYEVQGNGQGSDHGHAVYMLYLNLLDAYAKDQPGDFNNILKGYRKELEKKLPAEMAAARVEVFFNHFEPFLQCSYLYALVFVLSCLGWLVWRDLHWAAFWLAALTVLVHTWALITRVYLSGRPPVTNLYSSAVFIGWAAVIICLIIEGLFRLGVGNVVGGLVGVITLLIGHYLSLDGDTMQVLVAVLDTNFWLTTHVLAIALGYMAVFVAGFIGIIFVLLGPGTWIANLLGNPINLLSPGIAREVYRMIYGVACFGMVMSFAGTVLGGIWADQSWGRFWGWDPKENGALLIVLWCALMLHARWGGMVKARGFAVLAILGNIVTAWSWFGTNQLGIGLHAYGFMGGAMTWLLIFAFSQLALVLIGMVPDRFWLQAIPAAQPASILLTEAPRHPPATKMATATHEKTSVTCERRP